MVTGVTQFNDSIDGDLIAANNVFVVVDIGKTAGQGTRTAARKAESKDVIDAFLKVLADNKLAFPVECDIELSETATRAKENTLITAIRPVALRKAA